jgi:hypothetical protein
MSLTHECARTHVPIISVQLRCHDNSHPRFANPLLMNSFQDYRTAMLHKLLFLEFYCEILNCYGLPKCEYFRAI